MGECLIGNISSIDGVILTPLKVINVPGGDVLHGMKSIDPGYVGFGEAYFSTVDLGVVKAWKRHQKMTLNLIVPVGKIRIVIYDERQCSESYKQYQVIILSKDSNYCRLTIPPMVWMGFQGMDKNTNILLNIADIEHSPEEADRKDINEINFDWELTE